MKIANFRMQNKLFSPSTVAKELIKEHEEFLSYLHAKRRVLEVESKTESAAKRALSSIDSLIEVIESTEIKEAQLVSLMDVRNDNTITGANFYSKLTSALKNKDFSRNVRKQFNSVFSELISENV